ncbi:MAG TPA: hypothetical protein PKC41_00715 [Chitinophagaceae bacterium]|nr:hypothetical protein [Chitinophagaceae bacterium]
MNTTDISLKRLQVLLNEEWYHYTHGHIVSFHIENEVIGNSLYCAFIKKDGMSAEMKILIDDGKILTEFVRTTIKDSVLLADLLNYVNKIVLANNEKIYELCSNILQK